MGTRDPAWSEIAKTWEFLHKTNLDSLTPQTAHEYFSRTKELRQSLEKSQQTLRFYCISLLSKANDMYNQGTADPWNRTLEEWKEVASKWTRERPLQPEEITIAQVPILESYCSQLNILLAKVKKSKEERWEEARGIKT